MVAPSICIDRITQRRFTAHLRRSGGREIGGILLGEQLAPDRFRLVQFSIDDITGSVAHFCRSAEQHSEELEGFFEKTGRDFSRYNYLGEWHSHPRFPVRPSTQDRESMFELVHSKENIPFAVLLIVRLDFLWFLKASATIFSCNREPEKMTIERA